MVGGPRPRASSDRRPCYVQRTLPQAWPHGSQAQRGSRRAAQTGIDFKCVQHCCAGAAVCPTQERHAAQRHGGISHLEALLVLRRMRIETNPAAGERDVGEGIFDTPALTRAVLCSRTSPPSAPNLPNTRTRPGTHSCCVRAHALRRLLVAAQSALDSRYGLASKLLE